jgi:hypothetical protein
MQAFEKEERGILTHHMLAQAKLFLEDASEFYPFATAINKDNNIKPIGVYFENDNPKSSEVFNLLEKAIQENVNEGTYISAAIGMDVYVTNNGVKRTAIQIFFYSKAECFSEVHLYDKTEQGYIFSKA